MLLKFRQTKKKINQAFSESSCFYIRCIQFAMIALIIGCGINMDDWLWHVKCGEWVSEHGIIHNILFAWGTEDVPWVAHEWLFSYFSYLINQINENLSVWIYIIATFVAFYIVFCFVKRSTEKYNPTYEIFVTILMAGYTVSANMRPQYLDSILLVLTIMILYRSREKNNWKWLLILPIFQIFWVNFHMGTAVLLVFSYLIFFLCNCIDLRIGKIIFAKANKKWITAAGIIFVTVLLCSVINPYGIEGITYSFRNMQDNIMVNMISEWHAPDAKNWATLILFMLPMFFNFCSFAAYKGNVKASDIGLFCFYAILYLRSLRFGSTINLISVMLCYRYGFSLKPLLRKIPFMEKWFEKREIQKTPAEIKKYKRDMKIGALFGLLGASVIVCLGLSMGTLSNTLESAKTMNKVVFSDKIIEAIKKDDPKKIFNTYNTGGYLIYNDIQPFIYQSYEPFTKTDRLDDYLILEDQAGINSYAEISSAYDRLFEKYHFDGFLVCKDSFTLQYYIQRTGEFQEKAEDKSFVYYGKIKE